MKKSTSSICHPAFICSLTKTSSTFLGLKFWICTIFKTNLIGPSVMSLCASIIPCTKWLTNLWALFHLRKLLIGHSKTRLLRTMTPHTKCGPQPQVLQHQLPLHKSQMVTLDGLSTSSSSLWSSSSSCSSAWSSAESVRRKSSRHKPSQTTNSA